MPEHTIHSLDEENQYRKSIFNFTNSIQNAEYCQRELVSEKESLDRILAKLSYSIKRKKEQRSQIVQNLNKYYHGLLKVGLDTRKEGLYWIISLIWGLGIDVNITSLPSFLDEEGVNVMFTLARKDYSLRKLRAEIARLHQFISKKAENGLSTSRPKMFKTSVAVYY